MTIAMPVEDLESIEHLERDWSIPCEYRVHQEPCGAPASWWLICRACGRAVAECTPHRALEQQLAVLPFPVAVMCVHCRTVVITRRWEDLFIVEPIGARP